MRAALGETFYNVSVTPDELWMEVGRQLLLARTAKGWLPIHVDRAGGPSYKTVQAIEKGKAGTIDSLDKYATILGLSIVDILYAILEKRGMPLSPEAALIVRRFTETTVAGRQAMVSVANALPVEAESSPSPSPAEAGPSTDRPRQPARPAATRRTGR